MAASVFALAIAAARAELGQEAPPAGSPDAAIYNRLLERRTMYWLDHPDGTARTLPMPLELDAFLAVDRTREVDIIEGIVPAIGLTALIGGYKQGKSLAIDHMTLAASAGADFFGHRCTPVRTLNVEEEGAPIRHEDRLRAMIDGSHGAFIDTHGRLFIAHRDGWRIDTPADLDGIRRILDATQARFLTLDPLAQIADLDDENAAAEVNRRLRGLNEIASEYQISILFAHHRRKPEKGSATPTSVYEFFYSTRGSSAIMGAVDAAIGITMSDDHKGGYLYLMGRDIESSRSYYVRDPKTLLIYPAAQPEPSDAKITMSTALRLLVERGPLTYQEMEDATGATRYATRGVMRALHGKQLVDRGGRDGVTAIFTINDLGRTASSTPSIAPGIVT